MDKEEIALLREVSSRLAIAQVLTRYSRGIDRCDIEALRSVWWPEATSDYGQGSGNALEWSEATVKALSGMLRTQHMLGNMLIDLDGDKATAETYCRAFHELDTPDGRIEMIVGGRYLDRLEQRNGEWRIIERRYVIDWNSNRPSTSIENEGIYATLTRRGGRKPNDPFYTGE